jgi:hypothetical protein
LCGVWGYAGADLPALWRWMWEGESTPWYPTMRLFRQVQAEDRAEVMERVAHALGEWRKP